VVVDVIVTLQDVSGRFHQHEEVRNLRPRISLGNVVCSDGVSGDHASGSGGRNGDLGQRTLATDKGNWVWSDCLGDLRSASDCCR
jgi:hypothetical protein